MASYRFLYLVIVALCAISLVPQDGSMGPIQEVNSVITSHAGSDFTTVKAVVWSYADCFSLGSPEARAQRAITQVCKGMKMGERPMEICMALAFYIAGKLAGVEGCLATRDEETKIESVSDANNWFSELTIESSAVESTGEQPSVPQALRMLRESTQTTVDLQYHLVAKYLERKAERKGFRRMLSKWWSKRTGRNRKIIYVQNAHELLDQGRQVFGRMDPHVDPVGVRLTQAMLLDSASCKQTNHPKRERFKIGGKDRILKQQEMLEEFTLQAVQSLFDMSDCVTSEGSASDLTCRLLKKIHSERSTGDAGGISNPEATETPSGPLQTSFSQVTQPEDVNDISGLDAKGESGGESVSPTTPDGGNPAVETGEIEKRILANVQQAADSAVVLCRFGFNTQKINSFLLHVIAKLLQASMFVRLISTLLTRTGKRGMGGPLPTILINAKYSTWGKTFLAIQIQTTIFLSSGNVSLASLAAKVSQRVAQHDEGQKPVSLLQGELKPSVVQGVLGLVEVRKHNMTKDRAVLGFVLSVRVLAIATLITFSFFVPGLLMAVTVILTIFISYRTIGLVFHIAEESWIYRHRVDLPGVEEAEERLSPSLQEGKLFWKTMSEKYLPDLPGENFFEEEQKYREDGLHNRSVFLENTQSLDEENKSETRSVKLFQKVEDRCQYLKSTIKDKYFCFDVYEAWDVKEKTKVYNIRFLYPTQGEPEAALAALQQDEELAILNICKTTPSDLCAKEKGLYLPLYKAEAKGNIDTRYKHFIKDVHLTEPLYLSWSVETVLQECRFKTLTIPLAAKEYMARRLLLILLHMQQAEMSHNNLMWEQTAFRTDGAFLLRNFLTATTIGKGAYVTPRTLSPYAAPELIVNREAVFTDGISGKSDIWSLGVLLYEMFSEGILPYFDEFRNDEGRRYSEWKKATENPWSLRNLRKEMHIMKVPPLWQTLIENCLKLKQKDRISADAIRAKYGELIKPKKD